MVIADFRLRPVRWGTQGMADKIPRYETRYAGTPVPSAHDLDGRLRTVVLPYENRYGGQAVPSAGQTSMDD